MSCLIHNPTMQDLIYIIKPILLIFQKHKVNIFLFIPYCLLYLENDLTYEIQQ